MIRIDGAIDSTVSSAISWIARSVTPPLPWPRLMLMSCANAGTARDPAAISVARYRTLRGSDRRSHEGVFGRPSNDAISSSRFSKPDFGAGGAAGAAGSGAGCGSGLAGSRGRPAARRPLAAGRRNAASSRCAISARFWSADATAGAAGGGGGADGGARSASRTGGIFGASLDRDGRGIIGSPRGTAGWQRLVAQLRPRLGPDADAAQVRKPDQRIAAPIRRGGQRAAQFVGK